MLIKCQNCEHENQLGAIFCRNCGEKLDLDSTRPETFDRKSVNRVGQIVRRVVGLVLLLVLAYLLFAIFVPSGSAVFPTFDEARLKETQKKFHKMRRASEDIRREGAFTITPDEATVILKDAFRNQEGLEAIIIRTNAVSKRVEFIASRKIGPIEIRYTVSGLPTVIESADGTKKLGLAGLEGMIGRFTFPSVAQDLVIGKFTDAVSEKELRKFLDAVVDAQVGDTGDITLQIKAPKEKEREKE